jgi:hypothetical protein
VAVTTTSTCAVEVRVASDNSIVICKVLFTAFAPTKTVSTAGDDGLELSSAAHDTVSVGATVRHDQL